jgi:hypothetical protein
MHMIPRIDEVLTLLERFALGELDVSEDRIKVALRLIDLMLDDEPPDDGGGDEAPIDVGKQTVLVFPSRLAA